MNTTSPSDGFLYTNRDNTWPDFTLRGLDIVDGSLRLSRLPAPDGALPSGLAGLPAPDGPAGLACADDGSVYSTDLGRQRVVRADGCDGRTGPVACLGGPGGDPTRLRDPRGLLVHPGRRALLVADTGNHRLQVFDLATFQLIGVWGRPGTGPGRFDTPSALAADRSGHVYVIDRGNRRVQRFTSGGRPVPGFWRTLSGGTALADPVAVAVVADPGGERVCVLDAGRKVLVVTDLSGRLCEERALAVTGATLGLAVTGEAVYVGDNSGAGGRVVRLRRDGTLVGAAPGYTGPVAALALDQRGGLLAHPGGSGPPVRLTLEGAFVRQGFAWGGPFGGFTNTSKVWHRLRAAITGLPKDAHVRFSVHTTDDPAAAPPVDEAGEDPFPAPSWCSGPPDLGEFLIDRPEAKLAWVGLRLGGEGTASAAVDQIRLEFDQPTYLDHLPALYRHDHGASDFLPRYLALVESLFAEVEGQTADLSRLLDPAGAPAASLDRLASWAGLRASPCWSQAQLRDAIARAYPESAARGTPAGLRAALRNVTGVDAWIEEPVVQAAWWALADDAAAPQAQRDTSVLGVTTVLAAAQPQGAVLGSTAVVDGSHLIGGDEFGAPLFETVAHRFTVRVYGGAASREERLRAVAAFLDREKPAHTEYVICPVEPRFAMGSQARIGVDAVVGGEPAPARLDGNAVLGDGLVLGGRPPGQVGERARIGMTTLLGSASVQD
ncbi:phage tail protein [Wenjunlia tyrosinilytica]|uniref:NHL repeat-containing protein n=1 Tax=Wenjunlia tyrosinilytica TaxID=1544741 RepID=A0A917ZUE6_9ACTN|nr:phage tail protein [Wenjunlia tyrosinilytica]GGO94445.1 hypothetical protein GCM10012280_49310 [Wenjunlia tyrosinilytica]